MSSTGMIMAEAWPIDAGRAAGPLLAAPGVGRSGDGANTSTYSSNNAPLDIRGFFPLELEHVCSAFSMAQSQILLLSAELAQASRALEDERRLRLERDASEDREERDRVEREELEARIASESHRERLLQSSLDTLREENEKLAAKAEKAIELHNLVAKMANEDNASLQKKIDELQKDNKEYEFESCESVVTTQKVYGQAFAIQAERDKLQKELEEKKFDCEFLAKQLKAKYEDSRKIEGDTRTLGEVLESEKKLKEENKKLKEAVEEANCSMPDCCVDCDRRFDLHSAMNKITCEEDEGLRKKYDEYFGSDNDRGDLCKQCIREELP